MPARKVKVSSSILIPLELAHLHTHLQDQWFSALQKDHAEPIIPSAAASEVHRQLSPALMTLGPSFLTATSGKAENVGGGASLLHLHHIVGFLMFVICMYFLYLLWFLKGDYDATMTAQIDYKLHWLSLFIEQNLIGFEQYSSHSYLFISSCAQSEFMGQ